MSKNHPNDNIYSILGKLDALKPTPEEKHMSLVKEIRESVEAQGSILTGVDAVQAKLAKAFAESQVNEKAVSQAQQKFMGMVHAAQKGEKAASPEVAKVAKSMGKKDARDFAATKHKGLPQHVKEKYDPVKAVKQCAKNYMDEFGYDSVNQLEAEDIESIGMDCQMNYQDVCEILGIQLPDSLGPVKSYGPDKHGNIVDFEESTCNECGMCESECGCDHTNEGEITRTAGKTVHRKTDFPGYPVDEPEDIDDENKGKRGRPRKHAKKEPTGLGRGRPKKAAAVGSTAPKMHDPFGRVKTGAEKKSTVPGKKYSLDEAMAHVTANLTEGRHMVDESGETLNHILNRFRHEVRNFEQGGDLDKDLYDALFDYYSESGEMPYGVQKARTEDPMRWVAERLDVELGNAAYGSDPANAEGYGIEDEGVEGGIGHDLVSPQERLAPHNTKPGVMGAIKDVAKGAKDWIQGKPETGPTYEDQALEEELAKLAELAGIHTEGNAFSGKLAHTAKGDSFEQDGKTFTNNSSIADKELDEEETDEGNAFGQAVRNAKADGVQPGEKVEVAGKEIPVKEDDMEEGNAFGKAEQDAVKSGKKEFKVGEKTYTVKEAQDLIAMLKIAGLDTSILEEAIKQADKDDVCPKCDCDPCECDSEKVDEAKVEVDEPEEEPENKPDPKYASMKGSTMGPGEGDAGEKKMNPDRPTFKNGDNALSKPAVRESVVELESRLAAEYESIKKVS